jgi:MarR family transcriptional regulator, transcriptional regulator for hemolysin
MMIDDDPDIHPGAAVAPGYLANHAARVFNRLVDAELRPHGLTLALIGPVLLLSWKGPMRQRDLVRHSAVRQPAMVALLSKLERMGLIERSPTPDDRRGAIVALTAGGRAAAATGGAVLEAANARASEGFAPTEDDQLVRHLRRMIDNLEGTKHQT